MRVGIFYVSHRQTEGAQPVALPKGGHVYITVEEHEVEDDGTRSALEVALDLGRSRYDEENPLPDDVWLMNTHELPAQERS
jgi:hypothetical protein